MSTKYVDVDGKPFDFEPIYASLTPAGQQFFNHSFNMNDFVDLLGGTVRNYEMLSRNMRGLVAISSHIIDQHEPDSEAARGLKDIAKMTEGLGGLDKELEKYNYLLSELIMIKGVNNFLTYISDLLTSICVADHSVLSKLEGAKPVSFDLLQKYATTAEVVEEMIESRIDILSRRGMGEVCSYLKEKISFVVFSDDEMAENINMLIEIRNLLVHNRGIMNRRSLGSLKQFQPEVGKPIYLKAELVGRAIADLEICVIKIDNNARKQFSI